MSQPSPAVFITAFGKWHAFRLAKQLHRLGVLRTFYTAYPKGVPGVPPSLVVNHGALGFVHAILQRLGCDCSARLGERFDRSVARELSKELGPGQIVAHGWAGFSLFSLRTAKAFGAATFLERSSAHVAFQREWVEQECARWGVPLPKTSFPTFQVMMEEYGIAERIVVPSSFVASSFLKAGVPQNRLLTVPLGVDLGTFQPASPRQGRRPFRLLFVGAGTVEKGLGYLLQAWGRLRLPGAELWMVCPVSRPPGYSGSLNRVRWWRHFDHAKLKTIYQEASVFCLPSVQDGFGMVVLEAMACGLPVIISDHVGAKDCVRDGIDGFIVPIRNVPALAEKVETLYRNPDLAAEMGRQAFRRARDFSWDAYGDRMLAGYQHYWGQGSDAKVV